MAELEKRKYSEAGISTEEGDEDTQPISMARTRSRLEEEEYLICPVSKVGLIIGLRGVIIKEIMKRTGCKLVVDQKGEIPKVLFSEGLLPESIQMAKDLVEKIICEGNSFLKDSIDIEQMDVMNVGMEEIHCPTERVGILIGVQGQVIKDLMKRTGAKIAIDNDGDAHNTSKKVTITGTATQIYDARHLIEVVIKGGPLMLPACTGLTQTKQHIAEATTLLHEMEVPMDRVASVIGSRGAIIQEIMSRTRCKVVINQDVAEGQPALAVFTGTKEEINSAMTLVSAVVVDGPGSLAQIGPNYTHALPVQISQIGKIMGPQGKTIKEIQSRCQVKMKIEENIPGTDQRVLRFVGQPNKVNNAVSLTLLILEMGAEFAMANFQDKVIAPQKLKQNNREEAEHQVVYPEYKSTLLAPRPPIMMFQPAPPNSLALGADGSAGLLLPIEHLSDGMYTQIATLRPELIGRIVGKGGSALELLRCKSGSSLSVNKAEPKSNDPQLKIYMIGDLESVELAAKMIQELLINGPSRLSSMPDVPLSVPMGYTPPRTLSMLRPTGQQVMQMMPAQQQPYYAYPSQRMYAIEPVYGYSAPQYLVPMQMHPMQYSYAPVSEMPQHQGGYASYGGPAMSSDSGYNKQDSS